MSPLEWVAAFTLVPVGVGVTVWGVNMLVGLREIAVLQGQMAFVGAFIFVVLMAVFA